MSAIDSPGRTDPHRLKFLAELGGALRRLSAAADIQAAACEAIRRRLGAAGAAYAEGAAVYPDALSDGRGAALRAGETLHRDAAPRREGWILAPLMDERGLAAVLSIHAIGPRVWSETEIALVEVVAERTWDALERARATCALRESEARFRAMADCAPAPVWVTTADGRMAFANQTFVDMAGLDRDDLGDAWLGLLHPDDIAGILAVRSRAWAEGYTPYEFEARFRATDGQWRWMLAHSKPRFDDAGVFQGYVGLAIEQTETRAARAALGESEARFRLIAESAPVMLWMGDAEGRCIYINRAQREFWGVDADALPADFDWSSIVHPEDRPSLAEGFAEAMAAHVGFTAEARYRRADGQWRRLRTQTEPRMGSDGAFLGMIGVNTDVTDAVRAQEDLTRINVLLADRIGAALEQKEQAETALLHAQKMEAVGRLTGGVAHDFNNLLTVVIGSLDMVRRRPGDEARTARLLDAAMSAARRGERLTDQLLSFSRRQALRPQACDLGQLVLGAEPLLRGAIGDTARLILDCPETPTGAFVDPAQFIAAVLNLVVNARDAMPGGGGVVTVQTGRGPAPVDGDLPGDCVFVRVSDTGQGMPPEVMDRAFEPFFTTKAAGKGTGLGLSQVYGFARQSGGAARIDSRPGEGAAVEIFLPLTHGPADTATPALVEPGESRPLRILLVEDDIPVGAVAEEMLIDMGHRVTRLDSGEAALTLLASDEEFDLLLTDLLMPGGINGVELARAAVLTRPGLRVLLASGYVGEEDDGLLTGAPWPLLRKPYAAVELAQALVES